MRALVHIGRIGALAAVSGLLALTPPAWSEIGSLEIEIYEPAEDGVLPASQTSARVEGGASIFGGVRRLDLFLVLDSSKSLRRTDRKDYRSAAAIGLVESLSPTSDIRIGVVEFNWDAELRVGLTAERAAVLAVLGDLERKGSTDLAAGIREAVAGFDADAQSDTSRVILLFTDGKSDADAALAAMAEARQRGVAIHTLLLGADKKGAALLEEIAEGTGGSFLRVLDPAELPKAFLDLRTTGVESVTVRVNDSDPVLARLAGGRFEADVPVREGMNRIVAQATSLDGRTREDVVHVVVRPPGCGELHVRAQRDGAPVLSLSERAVELVFDASNSMWGRIESEPKISIAKGILRDTVDSLPDDLRLGLRVYGHRHARELHDCQDSELLAPHAEGNGARIREAIASLQPRGQTPLAYSLNQVANDFGGFRGDKAVVLVTDGIESCGGDPALAARNLQRRGAIPIHVIGFGLGSGAEETETQLRLIAEASGGRFLTAGNAQELREALAVTVGTPFLVLQEALPVARGTLGAQDVIRLPAGDYVVRVESSPPVEAAIRLASEESRTLTLIRDGDQVTAQRVAGPTEYFACDENDGASIAGVAPSTEPTAAPPAKIANDPEPAPAPPAEMAAEPQPTGDSLADVVRDPEPILDLPAEATPDPQPAIGQSDDGSAEVWADPEHAGSWLVVVTHPNIHTGMVAVWSGNDAAVAQEVARGVQDTLRKLSLPQGP